MLRVSWPFALLVVVVIALVARNIRLLVPMLIVFGVWFLVESTKQRKR